MSRLSYVIAAGALAIAPGNAFANAPPDFGEGMQAVQVAWKPMRVIDSRTIAIRGPRVTYCSNEPTLETFITEERSRIVVDAYAVRPEGPETKCLRRKVLRATVNLAHGLDGRTLYDGRFTPPRLRPLPVVPGDTISSP